MSFTWNTSMMYERHTHLTDVTENVTDVSENSRPTASFLVLEQFGGGSKCCITAGSHLALKRN